MKWSVTYVVVITLLGYDAFSARPLLGPWGELAAFLLLFPAVFVELPVIYVVGASAWTVREGMPGQPMWPVTVTFTVLFLGSAVLNVLLWRWLHRVTARSPLPPPPAPER